MEEQNRLVSAQPIKVRSGVGLAGKIIFGVFIASIVFAIVWLWLALQIGAAGLAPGLFAMLSLALAYILCFPGIFLSIRNIRRSRQNGQHQSRLNVVFLIIYCIGMLLPAAIYLADVNQIALTYRNNAVAYFGKGDLYVPQDNQQLQVVSLRSGTDTSGISGELIVNQKSNIKFDIDRSDSFESQARIKCTATGAYAEGQYKIDCQKVGTDNSGAAIYTTQSGSQYYFAVKGDKVYSISDFNRDLTDQDAQTVFNALKLEDIAKVHFYESLVSKRLVI